MGNQKNKELYDKIIFLYNKLKDENILKDEKFKLKKEYFNAAKKLKELSKKKI
jgi:hypothetical protein